MGLVILAGGKSSRMGRRDKAFLPFGDETMVGLIIHRLEPLFKQVIVVAKDAELYNEYAVSVVYDEYSGCGPISGIHAGLKASTEPFNLIIACDLPLVKKELVELLLTRPSKDVVIPKLGDFLEPLVAIYAKRIVPLLEREIEKGEYKMTNLVAKLDVDYVPESILQRVDPNLESFLNVNSPADYEKVKRILESR